MRFELCVGNKRELVRRLAEQGVKGPVVKYDNRSAQTHSSSCQSQVQTPSTGLDLRDRVLDVRRGLCDKALRMQTRPTNFIKPQSYAYVAAPLA